MNTLPFAIVGFDLDGTLLDTEADLAAALNHALALAGRPPVETIKVRELIGGGARRMLERALAQSGDVGPGILDGLHHEFLAYYTTNIAVHSRLYPGGEAMLDALAHAGTRLAVVTNKMESLAVRLLDELGLSQRFFTVIGGDTLGPGRAKPAPDLVLEMMARGGGGKAAFVGDTMFDTRAAAAAGLPCVAVSFGFRDRPADQLGATAVIDHYDDLLPTLRSLGG